jgi:hypothetical protein
VKKAPSKPDKRQKKIAEKIKQLRLATGQKSYEKFAWENDMNRIQYFRIEKGENITIATLLKVLDIHKISLKDFFSDIE